MSTPPPGLRQLATNPPAPGPGAWAARRINQLLSLPGHPARYLEIGLGEGRTIERVQADARWGVDPAPRFSLTALPDGVRIFTGTSDEFFRAAVPAQPFGVIYIDGLHHFEQTYRDLLNSLCHVAPGGSILIDDTVPCDEVSGIPDQAQSLRRRAELGLAGTPWHGDVWKVVLAIATRHPDLEFRTMIGSGNPQTLVWRAPGVPLTPAPAADADLERIAATSYSAMLGAGVPPLFRPATEDEALRIRRTQPGPGTAK